MSGLDKFTSAINSFFMWKNIPHMPNDGLNLLHARLRYALKIMAEEFKLQDVEITTNPASHICGLTSFKAGFFNVMIIPGRMYNRILVNKTNNNILINNAAPVISMSFETLLKNPKVLEFTIHDLIGREIVTKFSRKYFP